MEIVDKDFKNGFVAAFQYAVKVISYYLHVSFLEIAGVMICVLWFEH